ncbi:MAG: hypothetical protein HYX63_13305 [Gammaproteobacteria bacterium]|nr:hypothetical protein [Gammaproteobacteria bacterium]
MAVLAISALGAGIGSFTALGASTGWLIGSFIGNALFAKGTTTEGPRLAEGKVQSAEEGADLPTVFGTVRTAGTVIWPRDKPYREIRTKKKVGGKGFGGSSSQVTYTYSASLAIAICKGPIQGIRRIWADGKLIYSNAAGDSAETLYYSGKKLGNIRFYPGSETQTADPTIQAAVGAANTPAYRGTAYVVFTDFQLADFFNHTPNFTFEVVTLGTGTAPYLVNTFAASIPYGVFGRNLNGAIEVAYGAVSPDREIRELYDLNGVRVHRETNLADHVAGWTGNRVTGFPRLSAIYVSGGGIQPVYWALDGKVIGTQPITPKPFATLMNNEPGVAGIFLYAGGYIFVTNGTGLGDQKPGILRYPVDANFIPQTHPDKFLDLVAAGLLNGSFGYSGSAGILSLGDDGLIYVTADPSKTIGNNVLVFDLDFNFVTSYSIPTGDLHTVVVHDGKLLGYSHMGVSDAVHSPHLYALSGGVATDIGYVAAYQGVNVYELVSLGGGLALASGKGVISMIPPVTPTVTTVGTVVNAICQGAGLGAGQLNTSALTDVIDGYKIPRQMPRRDAIEPLRQGYFFDAVESSGVLKFVKRGGASVTQFTADDLGADGDNSSALFKTTRQQETELPIEVNLQYLDTGNDYQPGSQRTRRLTSRSKQQVSVDLAISMSSIKAAQVADVLMRNVWAERTRYQLAATRRHLHLEPTDIITLPNGDLARIVATNYHDSGRLDIEAVADFQALYASSAVGNDANQNIPQTLTVPGPTKLVVLDIPALRDADNVPGFYLGAGGYYSGWRGCEVGLSADNGTAFDNIATIINDATIGYTTTTLGTSSLPHQIDLLNSVTVTLTTLNTTLSSISDAALLAGGNLCIIGDEILQFGSATLVSAGIYTLSRFLRGRLGSEYALVHSMAGERFVMLNSTEIFSINRGQTETNVPRLLRAVTFGDALSEADNVSVTNTGRRQQPWSPIILGASPVRATNDWVINWVRRGRIGWWWGDLIDIALEEATEAYDVDILDGAGATVRTIAVTVPTATYTAAQQVADFQGWQSAINYRVAQKSALVGRGAAAIGAAAAPQFGPLREIILAHNPIWFNYSWTSTTVADDLSLNNLDGAFTGTKAVNDADSPILSDTTHRVCNFTGGYATVGDNAALDAIHDVSLLVWAKWSYTTANPIMILGKWQSGQQQYYFGTPAAGAGQLNITVSTTSGLLGFTTGSGFNDGIWHQLVGVRRKTALEIYVDGALLSALDWGNSLLNNLVNSTASLSVAAFGDGTPSSVFVGRIGPAAVFDHALSAAAIAAMHKSARLT